MLDQDSGDDDDNTTIRLRYLYRGEHKRDGRVATIACDKGTIKTKAVLAALRRDRSVDLDRFGVALYDVKEEAWRTMTDLDDEIAVEGEARAELYDTLEQETDDAADEAGYFGIGIVRGKTAGNAGVLWRSAAQLGAAFTFTVGARFEKEDDKTDAIAAWRRVPQFAYDDVAQLVTATPRGAALVGVEMGGQALETFAHPERCVYVLGAEDEGLPKSVRRACRHVVALPSIRSASYNVAVAGALVLYDRFMKRSRPVAPPPPLPTTVDVDDESDEPVYLPIILVQRDAATASRVDALLEQRHGAAVVRKATGGDLSTEEFARARARFSVARACDAGAVACSIAADPLLRGHVQRCLVLDRRAADVRNIAPGAGTYRVVAQPAGLATRVVDELPESVALGTAGATHLLCVCDFGGKGLLAGVAPAAARPRPAPPREPRGAAVLRELARRALVAPTVGRFEVVGNVPGAADYLQACGRAHKYSDSIEVLVADGRRPVSCLQRDDATRSPSPRASRAHKATAHTGGDGPARAVEVASQLLPQLHGVFVCVVAPRHRVSEAKLAAELAAALREALPAATRVGAPRCMWLLANAKLERTLLCRVNLKS